jgi:hypothetical protein
MKSNNDMDKTKILWTMNQVPTHQKSAYIGGFILVWCGFHVGIWQIRADGLTKMSTEIEPHITKKYEIKKRLGKGVSIWLFRFYLLNNTCIFFNNMCFTYYSSFLRLSFLNWNVVFFGAHWYWQCLEFTQIWRTSLLLWYFVKLSWVHSL